MPHHAQPAATRRRAGLGLTLWGVLLLASLGGAPALADSTALGPAETQAGQGEFTANTPNLTEYTQYSPKAILGWEQDIQQPADHTLGFRQEPGFAVLNVSPGVRASNFFGTVSCDATCIFANEAGIYFQEGSHIDVGGLIAAGGRLAESEFLAGQYIFRDLFGEVVNRGFMRGGDISLLGQRVANFGHIETPDGSFAMLAGTQIELRRHESPIVIQGPVETLSNSASDQSPFAGPPSVENGGTIHAAGGKVHLAAGDMLGFAIRQTGTIRAREIALTGGADGLVEVSGALDVRGSGPNETGGRIDVLGDYIAIADGADLDASGPAGGGKIRVGGDRLGQGDTPTAQATFLHANSRLKADALKAGDGGEIIVFAEQTAQVYGEISARGGEMGGDGGFVETSGRSYLDVRQAPQVGRGGEWLIDPNNISIVADSECGSAPQCLDNGLSQENIDSPEFLVTGPILRPTVDDTKITGSLIARVLEGGSNVTVVTQTIAEVPGTQVGNISVDAPIQLFETNAGNPDTEVLLTLQAAQNIIVNEPITVERATPPQPGVARGPSNLQLNILFQAGDDGQVQAAAAQDQIPNAYIGEIDLRAEIDTAGGNIEFLSRGIRTSVDGILTTNGGQIGLASIASSVVLRGAIDTSTDVLSEATGETLRGGAIQIFNEAIRVPQSGSADAPTETTGGQISVEGAIQTSGGSFTARSIGGESLSTGIRLSAPLNTDGGTIVLGASETTLEPVSPGDVDQTGGGRIQIDAGSQIRSGGAAVAIGAPDFDLGLPSAREVIIAGEIDSRVYSDDPIPIADSGIRGGSVLIESTGENARVLIGLDNSGPTRIVTNGGPIETFGTGTLNITDATLDTSTAAPLDDGADTSSFIYAQHSDSIKIASSTLAADESISLISGLGGVGDLVLSQASSSGSVSELSARQIVLIAGDGNSESSFSDARVDLGATNINFSSTVDPELSTSFALQQDADLSTSGVLPNLAPQLTALDQIALRSAEGILDLSEPDLLETEGLALTLAGDQGLTISSSTTPDRPASGPALDSLAIEIGDAFVVTPTIADFVTGTAQNLTVTAANSSDPDAPSLLIQGRTDPADPVVLSASESLSLHAGTSGTGDLAFEGFSRLAASDLSLRAGNGFLSGTSQIRPDGLANVTFSLSAPNASTTAPTFSLRQDASIDDSLIPDPTQFEVNDSSGGSAAGVQGIDYTLWSDQSSEAITLSSAGALRLRDTNLSLFGAGTIDLSALADDELVVRSLQIGGTGNFNYTATHNDKFRFSETESSRELTIRAGLEASGVLSFAGDLTITADQIRLVAGDGVGGFGTSSAISLEPTTLGSSPVFQKDASTGPDQFVFRQDDLIDQSVLPTLNGNFNGNAPNQLAIRSDDGSVAVLEFDSEPIFPATTLAVISAPLVNFSRNDGEDLILQDMFGNGEGTNTNSVQIRADVIGWIAEDTESQGSTRPQILPGTNVRVAAFDATPSGNLSTLPPAPFDFEAQIDQAPEQLFILQDASIGSQNLLPLSQVGVGSGVANVPLNTYFLESVFGGISISPSDVTLGTILPEGETELDLVLNLPGEEPGRAVQFIDPNPSSDQGFRLNSLEVFSPVAWTVQNDAEGADELFISANDFIRLLAAQTNSGNLTFSNVTLNSSDVLLQAGFDPFTSTSTPPPDPAADALPIVDTAGLALVFNDSTSSTDSNILRIFQHGGFRDAFAPAPPTQGPNSSLIINPAQITLPSGESLLDQMQFRSYSGGIDIARWGNGTNLFPTKKLEFSAGSVLGSGELAGGSVRIGQDDGADLNLSVDEQGNQVFESFQIFGESIELSTQGGDGSGVIRARGPNLLFFDRVESLDPDPDAPSTLSLAFTQDRSPFDESGDPGDCSAGCLPDVFQIIPSLGVGIDYTLESLRAPILVNDNLANKVWGSNLTLLSNSPDGSDAYDVIFDLPSDRQIDLFLESLTVGPSSAVDPSLDNETRILLRADILDAADDLSILTIGSQTFQGRVEIENPEDGQIELVGDIVEFMGPLDRAADDLSANLVVGASSEARFDGDIGCSGTTTGRCQDSTSALDRLRLNFAASPDTSVARFGGDDPTNPPGTTIVHASLIEFFALSEESPDTPVARSPIISTIYKKNGNLQFIVKQFTMGVGEKLSVQGDLEIDALEIATIGDLSAVNILVHSSVTDNTPTIAIQRRAPGSYLSLNGNLLSDAGVDYVADTIDFDGEIVLTGTGRAPIFGLSDPRAAPAFMNGYAVLDATQNESPVAASSFEWTLYSALPDLHPEGASRDDPSSMYWANDLVPLPPPWNSPPWLPWQRSQLTDLFVRARTLTPREFQGLLYSAAIIDDVGRDLQAWDGRPLPVAGHRLDGEGAKRAVDLFEQIFGADGGNVDHLRRVLQVAVDQYKTRTGSQRVVGFELRRFVKNRPSSLYEAHQLLEDLDSLFAQHRDLGLTPGEYRPIQARWLRAIRPEGITTRELAEAVQPSRYVRGSDVLDIFGD